MFTKPSQKITARIENLQVHLANENPLLVQIIKTFQELDQVGYRVGLLSNEESFTTRIAWWPMISVLGTFSAGKSTFINHYLGQNMQATGNQAVDDKFTVVCYSKDDQIRVLPGLALDADPRFPFYRISDEIEKVASGEGGRVDTFLQLKTCHSSALKGRIMIDSPGFDADEQRNSTLRITDHIVDLSDLVLVFFDARHPEPGAMKDTLEHLVSDTMRRNDSNKILFVLNQMDTTAREDNAEDVVAAWQRALAQCGLASGKFYTLYNEESSVPIEDDNLRDRYRAKRDKDMNAITQRMSGVSVERIYRIIGYLERAANDIEHKVVPQLKDALARWAKWVLLIDALILIPLIGLLVWKSIKAGYWQGLEFNPPWLDVLGSPLISRSVTALLLLVVVVGVHFLTRRFVANSIAKRLTGMKGLNTAFLKNTKWWRSLWHRNPAGWGRASRKHASHVREEAHIFVQTLNDEFTNPSGNSIETDSEEEAVKDTATKVTVAA